MKRFLMVLALVAIIATGTAFAEFGIGVHGGYGGIGGGGGLNLAFSNVFVYIDAVSAGENSMHVAGAVDFLSLYGNEFVPTLTFYIRVGVGAALWGFNDESMGIAAGVRLPIGLSWRPIDLLEIFLQAVPQIGARISGSDSSGSGFGLHNNFWGGNLGIRLWF